MSRHTDSTSAVGSADLEAAASRPSKTNCTTAEEQAETAEQRLDWRSQWWKKKNELVDRFVGDMSARAARPISVREGTKLREEVTSEKYNGGCRSSTWSDCLNEFLRWYNDYRYAHLKFMSPDGDEVRAPMPNSHQPEYGNKYYAKLKALEREIVREYDELYTAMLTFSGSMRNANDGWRCPADHMRDVVDSWRPDRGRGVYHALRDALDGRDWEYALVVEKHENGYAHVHCAVFVDGKVTEETFHDAIDAHLQECSIAYRDAHDYHDPDPEARPISVNRVDPDLDPEELDANREDAPIGNLGSYIGEYIGAYGEPLFERSTSELAFRSVAWATGTQIVRFSTGANELIARDLDDDGDEQLGDPVVVPDPDFDPDDPEGSPVEVRNEGWTIVGIGRVDREGEELHELDRASVRYEQIDGAEHLDPPKQMPPDRPQPRTETSSLGAFAADDD